MGRGRCVEFDQIAHGWLEEGRTRLAAAEVQKKLSCAIAQSADSMGGCNWSGYHFTGMGLPQSPPHRGRLGAEDDARRAT